MLREGQLKGNQKPSKLQQDSKTVLKRNSYNESLLAKTADEEGTKSSVQTAWAVLINDMKD